MTIPVTNEIDPADPAHVAELLTRQHAAERARRIEVERTLNLQNEVMRQRRFDRLFEKDPAARELFAEISRLRDENAKRKAALSEPSR